MINPDLLDAVLEHSTGKDSRIHGPVHWAGVAAAGLTLLDLTPDADPLTVLLFSVLHDAMRESDGRDPEHGARVREVKTVIERGSSAMAYTTRFDTDYGLRWDVKREAWVASDGHAFDGERLTAYSRGGE